MELWILVSAFVVAMALRLGFLAFHFSNLERLWGDYERRGSQYQLARLLDYLTLAVFLGAAVWTLWGLDSQDPLRLVKPEVLIRIFVAWLGVSLLARLAIHRFPRTNQPGGLDQAKIDLGVHLLMAVLSALAATAVAWVYFWWRG
jgi:hypothetical protein